MLSDHARPLPDEQMPRVYDRYIWDGDDMVVTAGCLGMGSEVEIDVRH